MVLSELEFISKIYVNSDQCDIKFVIRIDREHGQNELSNSVNRNHFNLKCCRC